MEGEEVERQIDRLFQQWYWLNGAVLVARVDHTAAGANAEEVVAVSTAYARWSGRLTWVVLDWLIRNVERIDEQELLQMTQEKGDLTVLGILCDLACSRRPHPKFDWLVGQCTPHQPVEIFFHRVARHPFTAQPTRENPHEVFLRWGYLCRADEVRFLGDEGADPPRLEYRPLPGQPGRLDAARRGREDG